MKFQENSTKNVHLILVDQHKHDHWAIELNDGIQYISLTI